MSTHQQTCYTCWSIFTTPHPFVTTCPTCQQTKAILKSNEQQARQAQAAQREAQWQAEQARQEQARIAAQHTQALIDAENARIAAINYQTQIIMESSITEKQAYDRGYNYIDAEFPHNNPLNLNLCVFMNGSIICQHDNPYTTPKLADAFRKAVDDRITSFFLLEQIRQTLVDSAKQAGRENATGTLPNHFTLYTGVSLGNVSFPLHSLSFKSNFKKELDETTGELKMSWTDPFFDDTELNQAYEDGVNEISWEENTSEKMNYRLRVQVPEIKAERAIIKSTKRLNKFFGFLVYAIPILFFLLMWQVTSGWVTVCMFFVSFIMRNILSGIRERWANDNQYLRKQK